MDTGRFRGKVAIVTGCGRGIGRAIAVRLATEGAAVVGSQRTTEEGDALVESLAAEGLELAFVAGERARLASVAAPSVLGGGRPVGAFEVGFRLRRRSD